MAASRRELTLNDGTQIWLRKDTGVVESVKDWSDTHVRSSGGGGYLREGTGNISAPDVRITSVHRQVFFLKCDDGTQKECDTTSINVGVGHTVTAVCGAKQGKNKGYYLGFHNHTTNREAVCQLEDGFPKRKLGWLLFLGYCVFFCYVSYGCLDSLGHGPISGPRMDVKTPIQLFNLWFIVSAGFVVYWFIRRRRFKRFYQDLTARVWAFLREG
jgi:hypothetical protein